MGMFKVLLIFLSLTLMTGPLLASELSSASTGKGSCCGMGHCATVKACCQQGGEKSNSAPVVPPQYESGKLVGFSSLVTGVVVSNGPSVMVRFANPLLRTQGPPLFVIHNSFLI